MSEVRKTAATGGQKGEKPEQFHTIPYEALAELARVYKFGASKYADYNYRLGYEWSLSFNAMMRHAWAFWGGEDTDEESGLNHMAHVAWHALNLVLFAELGADVYGELDDRPSGPAADFGIDEPDPKDWSEVGNLYIELGESAVSPADYFGHHQYPIPKIPEPQRWED